jgi:hypothetical protein
MDSKQILTYTDFYAVSIEKCDEVVIDIVATTDMGNIPHTYAGQ